ncbi:hypothetical protein [Actinophytocola sediminis]
MSDKDTERIRPSQVAASALAAVTAALLGSTMGVAGTVVGAGVASVVSTLGGVWYLRSIQRTKESVLHVRTRVVTRAGSTSVTMTEQTPEPTPGTDTAPTDPEAKPGDSTETAQPTVNDGIGTDATDAGAPGQPAARRRVWPVMVLGSVLAFVVGMAVITGVEWLRGEPLSGGDGTTLSEIIQPRPAGERDENPPPAPSETSTPPATSDDPADAPAPTPTDTTTAEPTGEAPTDPPAQSSEPETTTEVPTTSDPPTTTDSVPPPSG